MTNNTTSNARFTDYLTKISNRLNVQVEYSSVLDAYCFRTKSFQAMAMTNYTYYFFVHHNDSMNGNGFLRYADECFADIWNKPHKGGLAANQMVLPVLCQETVTSQTLACLEKSVKQKHTFSSGACCYPVILELSTGRMFFPTKTPAYGCAIWPKLKKMCTESIYYYA